MSDNGKTVSRILSLDQKRVGRVSKANDFITVQQAHDMVIEECAKIHEFYLGQIPTYVAQMMQDALVHYGLIVPLPENGAEMPHGAPAAEPGQDNTAEPQSGDAVPPADAPQPVLFNITKTPFEDTLTGNPNAPVKVRDAVFYPSKPAP